MYYFILGNNPALSIAEIKSVLTKAKLELIGADFLLVTIEEEMNSQELIKKLGGTIKIGKIEAVIPLKEEKEGLFSKCLALILAKKDQAPTGKFNFGISDYSVKSRVDRTLGLKLKQTLKKKEISTRYVVSRERVLSSVVVEQNKLLRRGVELVINKTKEQIYLGSSEAVQPFKSLSFRDYSRPARDDRSGMLPPKLAQIMLNLAEIRDPNAKIVDPFVGSGTVLSEAMLMGYDNLFGSDLSRQAVDNARENINWMKAHYQLDEAYVKLLVKDSLDLSQFIKPSSVEAIVTEPYLGPQRGNINVRAVKVELEALYSQVIEQFEQVLMPGGRVVMVWPVFYGKELINPNIANLKAIPLLDNEFLGQEAIKKHLSSRKTIIYGRSGQKVYREIVVLEK